MSIYARSSFSIKDSTGKSNALRTDGGVPSEFQVSKYRWPRPPEGAPSDYVAPSSVISFYDLNQKAVGDNDFLRLLWGNLWTLLPWHWFDPIPVEEAAKIAANVPITDPTVISDKPLEL